MRITGNMALSSLYGQVSKNMESYRRIQEQVSTEKQLLRPSDNPGGMASLNNLNTTKSANEKYMQNMDEADTYLKATDSALSQINDILAEARTVAELNATGSSNNDVNDIGAQEIQQLIDRSLNIANTRVRDRYIFSGYNTDKPAYSESGKILEPMAAAGNLYTGKTFSSGEFTGKENKSYLVRIVTAGQTGGAEYKVSEDGGKTWGSNRILTFETAIFDDAHGKDEGVKLRFETGTFAVGDQFQIDVVSGKYQGDDGIIEFNGSKHAQIQTNLSGQEVFENNNYFDIMYRLKRALENHNQNEIGESLEQLKTLQSDFKQETAKAGVRLNQIEVARSNMKAVTERVSNNIADIENVDVYKVLSEMTMFESALNSSVKALSKVLPNSLINLI
ncbi:MAG: flagellar hook-associated protein 3 [Candidatus Cloacimonadota bacterium]|nr:MAG: flagellar hook-associated protein 3 [Candidatus Cloacimonadota bacterium]